jgi:hypothetical protein
MGNNMNTRLKVMVLIGIGALAANQASANLVVNGDFESGVTGFTSGYANVTGVPNGLAILQPGGDPPGSGEGQYAVDTNPKFYHSAFTTAGDHTTGKGKMMIVNGSTVPNKNVWAGTLSSPLEARKTYLFSAWVMNVYHDGQAGHEDGNLKFSIGGSQIGTFTVNDVAGVWHQFTATYTAPLGGELPTAIDLAVNYYANDFALDDISMVPEPTTMIAGALLLLPFGASTLRMLRRRTA